VPAGEKFGNHVLGQLQERGDRLRDDLMGGALKKGTEKGVMSYPLPTANSQSRQ
jgi:hypothetical protein